MPLAIVMSGSKGINNYRHTADLYTWLVLLQAQHIPTISFSHDTFREIYHTCYGNNLVNLMHDTHITYTGADATKDNFINVISRSQSDDVLIVYINHGSPHVLSVPNDYDDSIHSWELISALNELATRSGTVTLIIEACYSGSFLNSGVKLRDNINIITASGSNESSFSANYCPELYAFTTDEFTNNIFNFINKKYDKLPKLSSLVKYVGNTTRRSRVSAKINTNIPVWFANLSEPIPIGDIERNTNHPNINNAIDDIASRIISATTNQKRQIRMSTEEMCVKRIGNIAKQLCYGYVDSDNIASIYGITTLCKDYPERIILNSIIENCVME